MDRVLTALREALFAGERALVHLDAIEDRRVLSAADCHIASGLDLMRQAIESRPVDAGGGFS